MSFDNDINFMDNIEACRTCGVFFLTSSSLLRQIFTPVVDDPEMMCIRRELNSWNIQVSENDGFPQFICTGCIHEFQNVFKFRNSCIDIQEQFRHFYNIRQENENLVHVKTEIPEETEENTCDFIYVDDISDTEHENLSFNIPHAPIKEELLEDVAIRPENAVTYEDIPSTKVQIEFEMHTSLENSSNLIQLDMPSQLNAESETNVMVDCKEVTSENNLRIKCELCNQTFANNHQHKLHMKRIHEIKDLECHICGKIFKNSSATRLKFHMKWHKLCKHTKCTQCSFVCSSRESLKEHIRETHSKINCNICSKLVFPKRMEYHMKIHTSNAVDQGTHCDKVSGFSYERDDHGNTNNLNGIFLNDTQDEEKVYSDVQNTFSNIEITCTLCDRKFESQSELELYVKRQHHSKAVGNESNENSENVILYESFPLERKESDVIHCINCNQEFYDQKELDKHMLHYHNGNIFENSFDGVSSDNFGNTRQETEVSEEYIFSQDYEKNEVNDESSICNNQFSNLHNFGCAHCPETFESVEHLRQHYDETHSKKPNFECKTCGKTFELKFSLNRHLKKHKNS